MILDYIDTGRLVSMEKEIFPQIIRDTGRFYGFEFHGYWMDIGRISSYLDVHSFLLRKKNLKNLQGKNCEIFGKMSKSCIGDNVHIGKNSSLDSVVVYDNAIIGDNVKLSYCVVGENCTIGGFSNLKNTVIGDNEEITEKSVLDNKVVWTQSKPQGYPDKQIGNPIENK